MLLSDYRFTKPPGPAALLQALIKSLSRCPFSDELRLSPSVARLLLAQPFQDLKGVKPLAFWRLLFVRPTLTLVRLLKVSNLFFK